MTSANGSAKGRRWRARARIGPARSSMPAGRPERSCRPLRLSSGSCADARTFLGLCVFLDRAVEAPQVRRVGPGVEVQAAAHEVHLHASTVSVRATRYSEPTTGAVDARTRVAEKARGRAERNGPVGWAGQSTRISPDADSASAWASRTSIPAPPNGCRPRVHGRPRVDVSTYPRIHVRPGSSGSIQSQIVHETVYGRWTRLVN